MNTMSLWPIALVFLMTALGAQANENCQVNALSDLVQEIDQLPLFKNEQARVLSWAQNSNEWQNPEFEASYLGAGGDIEGAREISLSLSQPIELGGKRAARLNLRQFEARLLELGGQEQRLVMLQTTLKMIQSLERNQRLLALYDESITSFKQIAKRINALPAMSPEKQIEKEALELAIADYGLKALALKHEIDFSGIQLEALLLKKCRFSAALLNEFYSEEEKLLAGKLELEQSYELTTLKSVVEVQKARTQVEQAQLFPNLKIGPQIEMLKEGNLNDERFGFNLSFDFPLWNRNQRLIESATLTQDYENQKQDYRRQQMNLELEFLINKYASLKKALKSKAYGTDIEEKHQNAERLFRRGVISSGLIIEVHRQMIELATSRQETQLEAFDTLWRALAHAGKLTHFKKESL